MGRNRVLVCNVFAADSKCIKATPDYNDREKHGAAADRWRDNTGPNEHCQAHVGKRTPAS